MTETKEPGWHDDPLGRHQHRWWDGGRWTEDVADAGVPGKELLPTSVPPVSPVVPPAAPSAPPAKRGRSREPLAWLGFGVAALVVLALVAAVFTSKDDAAADAYPDEVVADLQSACSAGGISGSGCDCILSRVSTGHAPLYSALTADELRQEANSYVDYGYADLESFTISLAATECGESFGINFGSSDPLLPD
jgi:hypothetical protein